MAFGGINYCGTLPAPREGKLKVIEYYVQAVDDPFQAQRTSTFQMSVVPEGKCEFPPVEKDAKRAARDQGVRHQQEAGQQARRRFRSHRGHLVPLGGK